MTDPVAAIAAAYEQIGRPVAEGHAHAITSYLAGKPRGKHGAHTYTAEEWGVDEATVRADLAGYVNAFDIAFE
jgi:hypothetical protein